MKYTIDIYNDKETEVYIATSEDIHGLVLEDESLAILKRRLIDAVSDLTMKPTPVEYEESCKLAGKCCLIARQRSECGCIALETKHDKAIAALVSYLGLWTAGKGIEVLTVSDPEVYGEYKPYEFVSSEDEFITRVLTMMRQT